MDLDSVADELYAASPDEFVERRKQQAAEARAAKDRDLVKAVLALRRPTRSAWLVNLLARAATTEVAALLELGAALGDAQRRGSGPDLRRLSQQRHTTIEALTRQAVALAADHGHAATEATRQEVSQTLQAALADGAVAQLVRAGRVVQAASYGGFGPLDLFGGVVPAGEPAGQHPAGPRDSALSPHSHSDSDSDSDSDKGEDERADPLDAVPDEEAVRARQEAEATVRTATEALSEARQRADQADITAQDQTTRADELADQVEALRAQLEAAEAAEREAQDQARAARKELQQAQRAVSEAEQTLRDAEAELTRLQADPAER
jgi:hypothetical protein